MRSNCYKYNKAIEITITWITCIQKEKKTKEQKNKNKQIDPNKTERIEWANERVSEWVSENQLPTEIKTRKQFQST